MSSPTTEEVAKNPRMAPGGLSNSPIARYGAAILTVGLALLITANLDFLLERSPFFLFYAAVVLVTRFFGRGPGIATVFLSVAVADFFIIPPIYSFIPNVVDAFRLGTFVLLVLPISLMISALQLREKKVRESESRLARIIDSAMDAIITLDSDQKIVLFNAAAETMFKCDAAEAIGEPIDRFIPQRFRAAHGEHVRKFGETRVTTRSMKSLGGIFGLRGDGEEFPIEASISQLETAGQKFFTVILRDITERTRSETRFRLAVESAPNAMVMADNDGKIILINSQTEKLFGYDRSELVGLPVETLVPERFRGRHPAHRAAFAADPQVRAMGAGRDLFGLRRDGTEMPVEIGLNPIEMEGGSYVLSSIVDITARKQAEEHLREAQERLSSTLLAGSIGTWTWDIITDELSADEFIARMFSLDPDAAANGLPVKAYLDSVFEEDQPNVSAALEKAIESCGSYDIEYRVRQKEGEFCWLQAKGRVEGDKAGNALNFHGAVMDITGRKLAEENLAKLNKELEQRVIERTRALRNSETRYSTLFDSIDEGFCIIEMIFDEQEKPVDYRFLEFNPSFEKQTGLRDALGKRMRELAPQHEEHWFDTYGRIAVTGEPARFSNHAEQLHRWFDVYACRFGEPKNRQVAIVFRDITEQTEAEANIAQLNAELQQRAAQLEEANKELESFSYSVSHDLRAPLRHIDGFVQMLTKREAGRLDDTSTRYLKVVSDAVVKMGTLIDELLAFSRTSRVEIKTVKVDLNVLVALAKNELAPAISGRKIKWKIADLPTVKGDAVLLGIVMTNLLSNAIKYSRRRQKAHIEIGKIDETNREVTIFVKDDGAGFDMKYADKLFGVFQRLHRDDEF